MKKIYWILLVGLFVITAVFLTARNERLKQLIGIKGNKGVKKQDVFKEYVLFPPLFKDKNISSDSLKKFINDFSFDIKERNHYLIDANKWAKTDKIKIRLTTSSQNKDCYEIGGDYRCRLSQEYDEKDKSLVLYVAVDFQPEMTSEVEEGIINYAVLLAVEYQNLTDKGLDEKVNNNDFFQRYEKIKEWLIKEGMIFTV